MVTGGITSASGPSHRGGAMRGVDVQVTNRSIAYRAKYRSWQGPELFLKQSYQALVVSHPKNRGGDRVVSQRTQDVGNFLWREGQDSVEASRCWVAVEGGGITAGCRRSAGVSPVELFSKHISSRTCPRAVTWQKGSTASLPSSLVCLMAFTLACRVA